MKGVNFRRVMLADDSPRRGLLGKGSILTVTALPNRTSPVVRGKWVLQNILGAPPPEPPPNVPALEENGDQVTQGARRLRERLEQHRANPVCASCHKLMDPIGFALENFDAVGQYRDLRRELRADRQLGRLCRRHADRRPGGTAAGAGESLARSS